MKAGRIHHFGPPSAIAIDEIPCPTPQEGELVVRVAAAGRPVDALEKARVGPVALKFQIG